MYGLVKIAAQTVNPEIQAINEQTAPERHKAQASLLIPGAAGMALGGTLGARGSAQGGGNAYAKGLRGLAGGIGGAIAGGTFGAVAGIPLSRHYLNQIDPALTRRVTELHNEELNG